MNRRNSGNGGIFPLLALVLLFVTVFGFFGQMDPTREMKRAYEKTVEILSEEEEEIRFLRQCLMQGKTTLSLGKETVTSQADLPRAASLSFAGKGYGAFKSAVGETVADALAPIRAEFARLMQDKGYLEGIMKRGAEQAYRLSRRTLQKVYKKVGFVELPR